MANALTLIRLALIPFIVYFILSESLLAVALFAVAALTDLFDGLVARGTGTVTEFGKILDPFTDRLLVLASVGALFIRDGQPPLWAVTLMLVRDVVLIFGYRLLKSRGRKVGVMMAGKAATALLMVSFILLIVKAPLAIYLFYLGLLLYLATGFIYFRQGKELWYNP